MMSRPTNMTKSQGFLRFRLTAMFAVCILPAASCLAQGTSTSEAGLKKFLQSYERSQNSSDDKTTRYAAAFVDLRDDGKQDVIVYLIGPLWCGSGGCSSLILEPNEASFKIITKTTVTQLPIRVLPTKTNGWHDLGVWVQGGAQPGYEARLKFNGKKYPSNPTVPPGQRLPKQTEGKVVIPSDAKGVLLW